METKGLLEDTRRSSEDEEYLWTPPPSKRHSLRSSMIPIAIAGTSGLVAGAVLFGLVLWILSTQQRSPFAYRSAETFTPVPLYGSAPSEVSNAAWEALIPRGRGFVYLDHDSPPIPYQDSVPLAGPNGSTFCLSMFHQLHCLDMLRRAFYAGHTSDPIASMHGDHAVHCFDYLRQAIMCAADTTPEPRDDQHHGVQGWGVQHQCRNFGAVWDWAERWRGNDNDGITN